MNAGEIETGHSGYFYLVVASSQTGQISSERHGW